MRLYIKQKVLSLKQKYDITDEFENPHYHIESKLISLGRQLTIWDMDGNEKAFVKQKLVSLLPRYVVEIGGTEVAQICKKFSLLKPKYEIGGIGWKIEGDYLSHDYSITENGRIIASIHKKWLSWGDAFELDIDDNADEVMALAVILAIDAVMDAKSDTH